MELKSEIFSAADAVLKIIKNEGELVDDMEYPMMFTDAYELLQRFDIIKSIDEKFIASTNFDSAYEKGVRKFSEIERQKKKALRRRKNQQRRISIAVLSSGAIAVAGYLYRKAKQEAKESDPYCDSL